MGRPKRLYPLGKYRLRTPKTIDKSKTYSIELEYTWNRQVARNKYIRNSSHFTYAIPRQNVLRLSCSAYLCRP